MRRLSRSRLFYFCCFFSSLLFFTSYAGCFFAKPFFPPPVSFNYDVRPSSAPTTCGFFSPFVTFPTFFFSNFFHPVDLSCRRFFFLHELPGLSVPGLLLSFFRLRCFRSPHPPDQTPFSVSLRPRRRIPVAANYLLSLKLFFSLRIFPSLAFGSTLPFPPRS